MIDVKNCIDITLSYVKIDLMLFWEDVVDHIRG